MSKSSVIKSLIAAASLVLILVHAGPFFKAASFGQIGRQLYSAAMMEARAGQTDPTAQCVRFSIRIMHELAEFRLIYKEISSHTKNIEHESFALISEMLDRERSDLDTSKWHPNFRSQFEEFVSNCLVELNPVKLELQPFVPPAEEAPIEPIEDSPSEPSSQVHEPEVELVHEEPEVEESMSSPSSVDDDATASDSSSTDMSLDSDDSRLSESWPILPVDSDTAGLNLDDSSADESATSSVLTNADADDVMIENEQPEVAPASAGRNEFLLAAEEPVFASVPASVFAKALKQIRHLQPRNKCVNLAIKVMHNVGYKRRAYAKSSVYTRNIQVLALQSIRLMNKPGGITTDDMRDKLKSDLLSILNHCERLLGKAVKRAQAKIGN